MGEHTARSRRPRQLDHDPTSLRWAIRQAGYTQAQIANLLGISEGHMSEIVTGKRNATPRNLTKLAEVLRCPRAVLAAKVARDEVA